MTSPPTCRREHRRDLACGPGGAAPLCPTGPHSIVGAATTRYLPAAVAPAGMPPDRVQQAPSQLVPFQHVMRAGWAEAAVEVKAAPVTIAAVVSVARTAARRNLRMGVSS